MSTVRCQTQCHTAGCFLQRELPLWRHLTTWRHATSWRRVRRQVTLWRDIVKAHDTMRWHDATRHGDGFMYSQNPSNVPFSDLHTVQANKNPQEPLELLSILNAFKKCQKGSLFYFKYCRNKNWRIINFRFSLLSNILRVLRVASSPTKFVKFVKWLHADLSLVAASGGVESEEKPHSEKKKKIVIFFLFFFRF